MFACHDDDGNAVVFSETRWGLDADLAAARLGEFGGGDDLVAEFALSLPLPAGPDCHIGLLVRFDMEPEHGADPLFGIGSRPGAFVGLLGLGFPENVRFVVEGVSVDWGDKATIRLALRPVKP